MKNEFEGQRKYENRYSVESRRITTRDN